MVCSERDTNAYHERSSEEETPEPNTYFNALSSLVPPLQNELSTEDELNLNSAVLRCIQCRRHSVVSAFNEERCSG